MFESKALRVCAIAVAGVVVSHGAANASCGTASWYHEGSRTANGERYQPDGISAAHRTLPFGTRVMVTHKRSGRSVIVRINDRGPFIGGRIIDLSRGAKRVLGMDGLAPVCITVLGKGGAQYAQADRIEKRRGARVAKARQQVREVYRTVQTSASYDEDDDRPVYRKRSASKQAQLRKARRSEQQVTARRERATERHKAQFVDNRGIGSVRLAGWPRSETF
jgi:rare lipoprotein A